METLADRALVVRQVFVPGTCARVVGIVVVVAVGAEEVIFAESFVAELAAVTK